MQWLPELTQSWLDGWFLPHAAPRATLLFFHGNAGNISHRLESIRQFLQLGLSVLIIDYRGYGQSEGRTTEQGIYRDAEAAWQYLAETSRVPASRIIVFGRSMGASAAAYVASRHRPLALVVESSFTSVPDIAAEYYPWLPVRWLSRLRHSAEDFVRQADCPVLVIHSRDDEIVPFRHGEAIFAAARAAERLPRDPWHPQRCFPAGRAKLPGRPAILPGRIAGKQTCPMKKAGQGPAFLLRAEARYCGARVILPQQLSLPRPAPSASRWPSAQSRPGAGPSSGYAGSRPAGP